MRVGGWKVFAENKKQKKAHMIRVDESVDRMSGVGKEKESRINWLDKRSVDGIRTMAVKEGYS